MAGMTAAGIGLAYGLAEYFYGDPGCGGADVQIPYCR